MKKSISFFLLGIGAMLTGCNNDTAEVANPSLETVQFTIATENSMKLMATDASVNNYVIEVYTDASCTTPALVFGDRTQSKATNSTGEFTAILDRSINYYLLCWADKKVAGTSAYNSSDLKAVTLTDATAAAAEAWSVFYTIPKGTGAVTIPILKRAVGKVSFQEKGFLSAGKTMNIKFKQPTKYNVLESRAEEISTEDRVIAITTTELAGTVAAPATITVIEFVLAHSTSDILIEFGVTYDSDIISGMTNIPIKANRNTNLIYHYGSTSSETLSISCDDVWEAEKDADMTPKP